MGNNLDQNIRITNEDKLMLLCAQTQLNPEIKSKLIKLILSDLNWEYLLKVAAIHRLTPLLYHNLNKICPEMVPDKVLDELKDSFIANIKKNLLMTGELIKILKILKSNNINAIPYKGPILANLVYGDISLREFNDIDILINKSDAIKLKSLMLSKGYELDLPVSINDSLYLDIDSEYRFYNKNNRVKVEINWNFEGIFFHFSA